jgi:hypothetical protein
MPIALTPHETWRFQLSDDYKDGKPDPNGTWWNLRSIPAFVEAQIQDLIRFELKEAGQLIHANRGTIERLVLEHGVVSVENWRDENGSDIVVRRTTVNGKEVAHLDFLDRLSSRHRVELANAISSRQKVDALD